MPKPVDRRAAQACVDYMLGWKAVGAAGDGAVQADYSPELRAFLFAALGENLGSNGFALVRNQAAALADYLRGVADLIDPPERGEDRSA